MDPTTGLVSANEELPEAFFELSSAEAAQIVASNRRKLENGNALLTKKHREREAQRRREKVRHATIRIMFQQKPISDVCVEAVFDAHKETVEDVYAFVEEILSKDDKSTQNAPSFELFVAPPKRVLKRNGRDANHYHFLLRRSRGIRAAQHQVFGNASIARPKVFRFGADTSSSSSFERRRQRSRSKSRTDDERPG